ncbi:MAG: hypothetical protein ACKVQC_04005 [Elusimicrobiota bacterium]
MLNSNKRNKKFSGVTLAELLVGVGILVFVLASAMVVQRSFSIGGVNVNNRTRVNAKLRSVTELIRYEASYKFDTMTASGTAGKQYPDPDIYDRDIKVLAWIDPVRSDNRTRTVKIKALWKENNEERTKEMNFSISQVRAYSPGANVKFKVVRANVPSEGIAGVKIEMRGQSLTRYGFTNSDGELTLEDVAIDKIQGIPFTVTGSPVCYFNYGGNKYVLSGPSWRTGPTHAAQTETTFFDTPIEGYLLSKLKIEVRDIDDPSNIKVNNGMTQGMDLLPYADPLREIFGNAWANQHFVKKVNTGVDGIATIDSLPPGDYAPVFLGNTEYPGVDTTDSLFFGVYTGPTVTLPPEGTITETYDIPKKGSIKGFIKPVSVTLGNAAEIVVGSVINANAKIKIYYDAFQTLTGSNVRYYLRQSMLGYCYLEGYCPHIPQWNGIGNFIEQVAINGVFQINNFTPTMLEKGIDYAQQWNEVALRTSFDTTQADYAVPAPLTPILVQPALQNSINEITFNSLANTFEEAKMLLISDYASYYGNNYELPVPIRNSANLQTTVGGFNLKVKTGGLALGNTKDIYFLNRDSLSNLSGEIRIVNNVGGDDPFTPSLLDPYDIHIVHSMWDLFIPDAAKPWERGFGYVEFSGGNSDKAVLKYKKQIDTVITAGVSQTYNFSGDLSLPLPPNLGQDKTVFRYLAKDGTPTSKDFYGKVKGIVKVRRDIGGGVYAYPHVVLPSADVDINDLVIDYTRVDFNDVVTRNVRVTNGLFDGPDSWANNVRSYNEYSGWSTPLKLQPRTHHNNYTVVIPSNPVETWDKFYLTVKNDTVVNENWFFNFPGPQSGPLYSYNLNAGGLGVDGFSGPDIEVVKEAKATLIDGYVRENTSGNPPIAGAIVWLKKTVQDAQGQKSWVQTSSLTDENGYYGFPNEVFFPYQGGNFSHYIAHVDFHDVNTPEFEGYNYDEVSGLPMSRTDIVLMNRKGSGGGGGGGGGL